MRLKYRRKRLIILNFDRINLFKFHVVIYRVACVCVCDSFKGKLDRRNVSRWLDDKVASNGQEDSKRYRDRLNSKIANIPVAVESNGSVGQNPKYKTNGRPSVTIDTKKAALLRILPSSAGYYDQVSRPSWMHWLQFHRLKSERTVSRYERPIKLPVKQTLSWKERLNFVFLSSILKNIW